jgi:phytanoyl-CoA dioxygenase PhyH
VAGADALANGTNGIWQEINMASEWLHRLAKPARKLEKAAKNTELTWRYGFNLVPTLRFRVRQPRLVAESARVVAHLKRDGVALTSVAALLGPNSCFEELSAEVAHLQKSLQDRIAAARSLADTSEIEIGKKTFLLEYLDHNPALDPRSIYARFALQPNIWHIANAYVGMLTRMRNCNVWHNFASQAQPRESQLWHRDPEDLYIVKVFVYLSDVDQGAGPFTYAPGTHGKGSVRQKPEYLLEGDTKRSTDAQMAAVVPRDNWVSCTGPRGTIVFADTRGYHKGGLSKERDRVLYTCMFTS